MLCLVIFPLDYKRKGHIVDDVSFRMSIPLILSHGFSRLTVNAWHYGNLYSIYGFFFNYRVWFCFQVKPLPRGCRLTVRFLNMSFHASVLILILGTLRCKLIGSVILSKKLILSFIFKACHSGSILGMFVTGINPRLILIFFLDFI